MTIERVVVINDYTIPEGGAGTLAMASVRLYRARGLPVTVLTGQGETDTLSAIGADVHGLGSEGLLKTNMVTALRQGYHNRGAAELIETWVAENDTPRTVYHVNNWSQILSPAIFVPLRKVAARTIVTCHDFFNVCPNGGFLHFGKGKECQLKPMSASCFASQCDRRSALHKYWRFARQLHFNGLAKLADTPMTFTAIHKKARKKFVRAGFKAKDLRTVLNPVEPWSDTRIAAEKNDRLLFVGRVSPDKGADIALEAGREAGMPVTIAGTGPDMERWQSDYPEAHFAGWCDRAALLEHAKTARAVIVPSRVIEPFGLAILEAAISGLPVFVSKSGYLGDEIEEIGAGQIIDTGNIPGIAAQLKRISEDDALTKSMSEAGFQRARNLCNSNDSWIDAFLEIFEEKLAQLNLKEPA